MTENDFHCRVLSRIQVLSVKKGPPSTATLLAGLSTFLTKVLLDSGGDQVILADHNISATCGLLNFLYTGMQVEHYSEPVGGSNGGRVWGEDMVLNGQKKS